MNEVYWGNGGPAVGGSALLLGGNAADGDTAPSADAAADNAEIYVGTGGPAIGGEAETN